MMHHANRCYLSSTSLLSLTHTPPGGGGVGPGSVVLKTKTDVLKRKITDIVLWLLWNIPAVGLSVIEMVLRLDS